MIRAVVTVIVACLVVLIGAAWFLLATSSGAAQLIDFGVRWIPGQLEVSAVEGSLARGLRAKLITYRRDELTLQIGNASLDLDLMPLLSGTLAIERLAVESVTLNSTPLEVRAQISGVARLAANLPLEARVAWDYRNNAVSGHGRFTGTLDHLEFTHRIELPDTVHVEGAIDAILQSPAVSAVVSWEQLTLPEQNFGALQSRDGEVTIAATPDDYEIAATAQLIRDESQQLTAKLSAHGNLEQLIIDVLQFEGLGGELQAGGSVEFGDLPRVLLQMSGRDFDPGVLLPGYDGRLNFSADIDARWPERLMLNVSRLDGEFLGSPVRGAGELLAMEGALRHADARLQSGANKLHLTMRGRPQLSGEFAIDAPELASLWPGLTGELHGSGTLAGTIEAPQLSVDLDGLNLGFGDRRIERLRVVGRADANARLSLEAGADGVFFGGQFIGDLSVAGAGLLEAHTLEVILSGGVASTNFNADGSWDGEILTERILDATIDTDVGAWTLREPVTMAIGAGGASVTAHCWDNTPASVCTSGVEMREGQLTAAATLTSFPLQTLNPWLGEDIALAGEADAALTIHQGPQEFNLLLDWKQRDTRLIYQAGDAQMTAEPDVETRLEDVELTLVADEQSAVLTGSVGGEFGLTATVAAQLENPLTADGALAGSVQAEIPDIGELRPLVDRYVQTEGLVGALVVDIRIGGTRAMPTLDGSARLRDAAATLPLLGIEVEDLEVGISAGGNDTLVINGSARSGGGTIKLSGTIGVAPETGLYSDLAVTGERFQLLRLPDQSMFVSPDLTARFADGRIELDGRLLVPEAAFNFVDLGDAAITPSEDVVVHGALATPDAPGSRSRIAGQLAIEIGDAVTFDGLGIKTHLAGGLLISLRPDAPLAGEGALQVVDGTYDAFGREMLIERGSLNFYGPLDDPVLDVRASRRLKYEAQDIKIGINLSGRLSQQLEFVLFSEPAMSEADVLAFIVTGRPASTGTGSDGAVSGAALAMGLQSMSATRRVSDSLSLDEMSFEGGAGGDTAVVAGKRLGEDWYVRYTYGLFDRIGTFIIRYDIGRGVSIEAGSGAQQSLDLIYSIDR